MFDCAPFYKREVLGSGVVTWRKHWSSKNKTERQGGYTSHPVVWPQYVCVQPLINVNSQKTAPLFSWNFPVKTLSS